MENTTHTTEYGFTLASGSGSDTRHIVAITGDYYGAYAPAAVCGTSPRIRWASDRWFAITATTFDTPAAAVESTPATLCKRCAAAAAKLTPATENTPAPAESLEENTMTNTPAVYSVPGRPEDAAAVAPVRADAVQAGTPVVGYLGSDPVVSVQAVTPAVEPGQVVVSWKTAAGRVFPEVVQASHLIYTVAPAAPEDDAAARAAELAVMSAPGAARVDLDAATAPAASYRTARAVVTAYFQGGPGRGECIDAVILQVTGGDSHPARNFAALDAIRALEGRVSGTITAGEYQTIAHGDRGTIFVYGTWSD